MCVCVCVSVCGEREREKKKKSVEVWDIVSQVALNDTSLAFIHVHVSTGERQYHKE